MNTELKTSEDSNDSFSPEEMRYNNLYKEGMYHSETMSKEKTKRISALSIIAIALSISMIAICSFTIWRVIHVEKIMKGMQQEVSELSDEQQFDEARDVAKREKYRASDLWDFLKRLFAGNLEESIVDRKEADYLLKNGLTIGRSSSDFLELTYEEAQEELNNRGFKNVISSYIISNSNKYKRIAEDKVIGIRISDRDKFKADDKFLPDSPIEILYLKKSLSWPTDSSDSTLADPNIVGIIIGRSSTDFAARTYEAAETELISKGFTNVTSSSIVDNSSKYKGKPAGTVIKVKIDGKEKFSAEDKFSPDTRIEILFLKRDSETIDSSQTTLDAQDRPITIGKSSKELKRLQIEDVKQYLIDRGFDENQMLISSIESQSYRYKKTEDGAVISISIDGKAKFKETDKFAQSSTIEINYYKKR